MGVGFMSQVSRDSGHVNYVEVDKDLCNGCVLCIKACPTKAIRVKKGKARIQGICIHCAECIRVCPRRAMKAITSEEVDLSEAGGYAVSASTVLYSQFGDEVLPNDILLGLRRMGFVYVHDQPHTNEMFNYATRLHIKESRKNPDSPFPLISPVCPVVVRLIAYRFPSLWKHILPMITPREIVARETKKRLSAKFGPRHKEIKTIHITPCPSKTSSIKEPILQNHSYLDTAIGINHIHDALLKNIQEIDDDEVLHHSSGLGLCWGMSGGEIAGLESGCLAVSGLRETIHYLEKIEMGLLHEIDYVEFRTCTEGCLGGPFTVADKYLAKHHLQKLIRIFGVESRIKYKYVIKLYKEGWFSTDRRGILNDVKTDLPSIAEGIKKLSRVEKILQSLPGKECGVCGSPDCRTFAEDIVDGSVSLKSCIFLDDKSGGSTK